MLLQRRLPNWLVSSHALIFSIRVILSPDHRTDDLPGSFRARKQPVTKEDNSLV
jgi:hypothetical protein